MNLIGIPKRVFGLTLLAVGVWLAGAVVVAQEPSQGSGQPARAVRLSYVDGQVKLSQGDQVMADNAVVNTPLFEGMQLATGDDGKAEIQFEDGSVARLAPDSSLTISVLSGSGSSADAELTLDAGLAYFEFQGVDQAGQFSVHFGSSVATTSGFTALRVNVDDPPGSLAVFSGNVHLDIASSFGVGVTADLHGGENVALNPADASNYSLAESIEPNSWDAWNSDRDQSLTTEATAQTDAPENVGATQNPAWNDLDANGTWYNVPDQGYVWSPYDAENANFDPYGNGNWIYTVSYGYVWASGYQWGYMPYHCGSWNFYPGFGWGWAPGAGGCNPWWGAGFYGGPNIGIAPVGYRPVLRPLPPHWPIGHRPIPIVPVHRHIMIADTSFPARDKNTQVTIAGSMVNAVQPRPVVPRQSFVPGNRPVPLGAGAWQHVPNTNRPPVYGTGNPQGATVPRQGYAAPPVARPGFAQPPPNRSYNPPPRNSSGSGPQSHPSGGSAPHWSGGGNNGGGSHPSGGGNSGGGGHH